MMSSCRAEGILCIYIDFRPKQTYKRLSRRNQTVRRMLIIRCGHPPATATRNHCHSLSMVQYSAQHCLKFKTSKGDTHAPTIHQATSASRFHTSRSHAIVLDFRTGQGFFVCLRQPGLKKAKYFRSLSPQSDAPRRIGAVADERFEP